MLKRLTWICGIAAILLANIPPSSANALTLTIPAGAEPEIVFDHARDACEKFDVPDVPARAFRASDGTIRLIASHWTNRAMAGATLDSLRHACDIVFEGGGNDDPAAFDDRGWIVSTYTLDGKPSTPWSITSSTATSALPCARPASTWTAGTTRSPTPSRPMAAAASRLPPDRNASSPASPTATIPRADSAAVCSTRPTSSGAEIISTR